MTYSERKEKLEQLLTQIKYGMCNSLNCIAKKFNCSESTAKRMISELRNDGYMIVYCRSSKKFKIK